MAAAASSRARVPTAGAASALRATVRDLGLDRVGRAQVRPPSPPPHHAHRHKRLLGKSPAGARRPFVIRRITDRRCGRAVFAAPPRSAPVQIVLCPRVVSGKPCAIRLGLNLYRIRGVVILTSRGHRTIWTRPRSTPGPRRYKTCINTARSVRIAWDSLDNAAFCRLSNPSHGTLWTFSRIIEPPSHLRITQSAQTPLFGVAPRLQLARERIRVADARLQLQSAV
jgi:hypothetical protein